MSEGAIIDGNDVLIVVDVQNDFCPGGALAVPRGDEIVPIVNRLAARFHNVVLTQDWHPPGHFSFASTHPGKNPFETAAAFYGPQMLWPDHCTQGTPGAAFHSALDIPHAALVLRKGMEPTIDSYSAFYENDRTTPTGLRTRMRAIFYSPIRGEPWQGSPFSDSRGTLAGFPLFRFKGNPGRVPPSPP